MLCLLAYGGTALKSKFLLAFGTHQKGCDNDVFVLFFQHLDILRPPSTAKKGKTLVKMAGSFDLRFQGATQVVRNGAGMYVVSEFGKNNFLHQALRQVNIEIENSDTSSGLASILSTLPVDLHGSVLFKRNLSTQGARGKSILNALVQNGQRGGKRREGSNHALVMVGNPTMGGFPNGSDLGSESEVFWAAGYQVSVIHISSSFTLRSTDLVEPSLHCKQGHKERSPEGFRSTQKCQHCHTDQRLRGASCFGAKDCPVPKWWATAPVSDGGGPKQS